MAAVAEEPASQPSVAESAELAAQFNVQKAQHLQFAAAREGLAKKAADEAGVNYADIEELAALYPTTPKRAVELRRRLKDAGKEIEWDI